jgi:hypothetical protein
MAKDLKTWAKEGFNLASSGISESVKKFQEGHFNPHRFATRLTDYMVECKQKQSNNHTPSEYVEKLDEAIKALNTVKKYW